MSVLFEEGIWFSTIEPRGSKRHLPFAVRSKHHHGVCHAAALNGELTCSRWRSPTRAAFLPERPAAGTTSRNPPGPRSWSVYLAGDRREPHTHTHQQGNRKQPRSTMTSWPSRCSPKGILMSTLERVGGPSVQVKYPLVIWRRNSKGQTKKN